MYRTPKSALSAVRTALNAWKAGPTICKGRKVLAACDRARDTFERDGWPDDWAVIQRAADEVALGARAY